MTTDKCNVLEPTKQFTSGTAEVLAPNGASVTSYPYAFLATDFVALWEVEGVPDSIKGCRLRWRSLDKEKTRYFRIVDLVPCEFPAVHVDLRLSRELVTDVEIKARQDEIVAELSELAKPIFSQDSPTITVPIERLFERGKRDARRELLRRELRDLSVMLAEVAEADPVQKP